MSNIEQNTSVQEWIELQNKHQGNNPAGIIIIDGIDGTPEEDSTRLITSGGVKKELDKTNNKIDEIQKAYFGEYRGTDQPVYVFRIDTEEDDPEKAVSYPANSANANFTPATKGSLNSWEGTFIDEIAPCTLKENGQINYWLDKADIFKKLDGTAAILTGADGNVCTAFPTMYWKSSIRVKSWKTTTIPASYENEIAVSRGQFIGSYPYAHVLDGTVNPYVFVGCFQGLNVGGALKSRYSTTEHPTVSQTNDTFQAYAAANGAGYSIMTYNTWNMINILAVLIFKNLNIQAVIGNGNVNNSAGLPLGSSYRAQKGGHAYGTTAGTDPSRLFWIENFWGDRWQFLTGIIKDANNVLHINKVNTRFVTQNVTTPTIPAADHTQITTGFSKTGGYISKFFGADPAPFFPAENIGASNKFACDYYWYADGLRTVVVGGNWDYGARCGLFHCHVGNAPSSAFASIGARLQKIGTGAAAA